MIRLDWLEDEGDVEEDDDEEVAEAETGEDDEVGEDVVGEEEEDEHGLYPEEDAGLAEAMEQVEDKGEGRTCFGSWAERRLK